MKKKAILVENPMTLSYDIWDANIIAFEPAKHDN
jgi:hypothetical protein